MIAYADIDFVDMSDGFSANQSYSLLKFFTGTLLAAHLHNAVVLTYGFFYGKTFGDGVGQRFLTINVFTGLAGIDGHEGMPMVGSSYFDGVDVMTIQEIFIEFVNITTLGNALAFLPGSNATTKTFTLNGIYVTATCNLHSWARGKALKIAATLLPKTYKTENDAVAWSYFNAICCPTWQDGQTGNT